MSIRQAAFLTSRVISLCFFYSVLTTIVQVAPAFEIANGIQALSQPGGLTAWAGSLYAEIALFLTKTSIELLFGILFYRFGPMAAHFLLGKDLQAGDPAPTPLA